MNSNKKTIIGITGGIASGKSLVAEFFHNKNIPVINADRIGHEILRNEDIKQQLVSYFGNSILQDGEIARRKLGKIVFEDSEKLRILNALVHPALVKEILRRVEECADQMIVIDAALLFQWNMNEICTYVILITAPEEMRISRLVQHAHLPREEAEERIRAQQEFPEDLADFIVIDDGTIKDLNTRIEIIWETIHRA